MAADGFKEAGYKYVLLTDCYSASHRTPSGKLQADASRFPSGIKALANYVSMHHTVH